MRGSIGPAGFVPDEAPAGGTAPPPVTVTRARRYELVTCLYRQHGCGCAAPMCWWKGRAVTLAECEACHP